MNQPTFESLLRSLFEGTLASRVQSALMLGASGQRKAVGGLVQALKDGNAEIRVAACDALGSLGDSRAIAPLVSMLRDADEDVRGEAFSALIAIGESRARALPDAAFRGEDPNSPSAALTQIVWPADLEAIQLLHGALTDSDPEVRIGALYTLGHLGVAGAFEGIERAVRHDEDTDVRAAAGFALGELAERGEKRAESVLRQIWLSSRDNTELAVVICRALGALGHQDDLPLFQDALSHADNRVRQLGAMAAGNIGTSAASPLLVQAMKDEHSGVRRIAVHGLGLVADIDDIPALIGGVIEERPEVRAAIGEALKRYESSAVHAGLTMAARSPNAQERAAAAYLMGRIGLDCGLAELLSDPDATVRKATALSIGQVKPAGTFRSLVQALSDESWMVCVAALESIRRLKERRCMPQVNALAAHENHVVRNAVRLTLDVLAESVDKDRN